jgi:putative peptidoglycan lipid II flippase
MTGSTVGENQDRRIAKSAAIVAFFVIAAKSLGAVKEMMIAERYGVSEIVDVYQVASTFLFWIPNAISSALIVVLIPILVSAKTDRSGLKEFTRELKGVGLVVGALIASLTCLAILIFTLIYPANALSLLTPYLLEIILWSYTPALLTPFIALQSARLMANSSQVNTLFEAFPSLAVLVCLFVRPGDLGILPMMVGLTLGYLLQTWGVSVALRKSDGAPLPLKFTVKSTYWLGLSKVTAVMLLGQFFMSWVAPIDTISATALGKGAVSQLAYAEKIVAILLGIGAVAISRAILPVLSEMSVNNRIEEIESVVYRWVLVMLAGGALTSLIIWLTAPQIVNLLFERGRFTQADSLLVVEALRWGLIRLPFYFAGLVFVQFLASRGQYWGIALVALTCVLGKKALNDYFTSILGVPGINAATGAMYAWSALLLFGASFMAFRRKKKCV